MPTESAGLLVYRIGAAGVEVLLVHPGGPYWRRKDAGAWTIPKGELDPGEEALRAARREFEEETGFPIDGPAVSLGVIVQKAGKRVHAWAVCADLDVTQLRSNPFEIEWPPRSGTRQTFPEVDRAAWFPIAEARVRMLASQTPLLDRLLEHLGRAA